MKGRNQGRMNAVTCFPLQPFVPRMMSLNTVFFKEGLASLSQGLYKHNYVSLFFPQGKTQRPLMDTGSWGHSWLSPIAKLCIP